MKKIISIVTTTTLLFTLSACGPRSTTKRINNPETNQGSIAGRNISNQSAVFRDGTYTGIGDGHANGNENATVTVTNGRISNVVLGSINTQGKIMQNNAGIGSSSDISNQNAGGRQTPGNTNANTGIAAGASALDQLKSRLTTSILQNQTDEVNLDGVDGILSDTYNNWKLAVKRALDKAR